VLIAVLFLVALILIGLAVAAPKMAKAIQRDKELELTHRGEQYKRAIKLYYRKFGSYPSSIDQLMNTNQVRFLRKRYKDPMTNKDDWKLVYFGQAHVQPLGLFGQALAGTGLAGAAGGVGQPIAGAVGGATNGSTSGAFGSSSGSSSGSSFGSSSGSSFGSSSGSGSSFGSSSGSSFGGSSSGSSGSSFGSGTGTTGGTDTGGSGFGSSSGSSFGSSSGSGFGSATGTSTGSTPGTTGTGGAFGSSGSTSSSLGGVGPIVGVVIPDTRASIKEYKKQKHYNEWEFVYNPVEDQLQGAMGGGQQNLNGATPMTGAAGSNTGFSSNIGGATLMNGGQNPGGLVGNGTSGTGSGSGTNPPQQ
jgi:type II secretory pathway pseudopilin PulG